jgi:hypothetical protein
MVLNLKINWSLIINIWPGSCKIVNGRPRCPWVQRKVEQSNGTLQSLLTAKMAENKTDNWVDLLPSICYAMNINYQNTTKTTPYNILMGCNPNLGLDGFVDGGDDEVINYIEEDNMELRIEQCGSESLKANSERESGDEIEASSNNESDSSSGSNETSESEATRKFLLDNVKKRQLNNRNNMANQHNQKHKKNKTIHTLK